MAVMAVQHSTAAVKISRMMLQPCSQEAGGSNSLMTGDVSVWRRHSTNSSTRATLEKKDAKHAPAISTNPRPPKFRKQIIVAVEHSQMAINETQ
jgi:hypothetical protein